MFRISILFPECQANMLIDLLLNELLKLIIFLLLLHTKNLGSPFLPTFERAHVRALLLRSQKLLTTEYIYDLLITAFEKYVQWSLLMI